MMSVKIAVVLAVFIRVISSVVVETGVYKGITIGIHSGLSENICADIVNSVTSMFQNGNGVLSTATGLDFGSIYIIIPEKWTSCGAFNIQTGDSYLTYNVSDIRVGNTDPIFGDEPWTSQPRECGLPGEFISFPYNWLWNTADSTKGSRLVQEWAKFRWGVFEEYGHNGDLVYPESIRRGGGSWEPNYCTNSPLNGNFDSNCGSSTDCHFTISGTPEAASSLMATPSLSSVTTFCDSGNHRADIPSKQNIMCNYTSTWDIIKKHPDISQAKKQRTNQETVSATIDVKIVRENFDINLVIAYETSSAMDDIVNRFDYETESIAQFITYEAPSSTSLGLVSFDNIYIIKTSKLSKLSSPGTRKDLSEKVLKTKSSTSKEKIELHDALSASAGLLSSDGNGIILLVTKCTGENPTYSPSELAEAANGHPVWIILYPKTSDSYLNTYSQLAYLTGGMLIIVEEKTSYSSGYYSVPNVRMKLSQAFRQLLHQIPSINLRQISYQTCPADKADCSVSLEATSDYRDPMYVYLYHDRGNDIADPDLYVSTGTCSSDEFGAEVETTYAFKCSNTGTGATFDIKISRKIFYSDLIVELVGRPFTKPTDYIVNLKGSTSLFTMSYTTSSAPAVFVQVSYSERTVVYANVYAVLSQNNNVTTPSTIYLRDDGSGADVTGNDGIYSAYLIPVIPVGDFTLFVSADDNKGNARFLPTQYDGTSRVCCGSKIPLPSNLDSTGSFSVKNYPAAGTIIKSPANLNLPPGTVKDLSFKIPDDSSLVFTFTDVGGDLDFGTVDHYMVKIYGDNGNLTSEKRLELTPKTSGSSEVFSMPSITCYEAHTVSIYAVDGSGLKGGESNRVTAYDPCSATSSNSLSAGAWVGIAIAALVVLLLFIAGLLYAFYYKDKSKFKDHHTRLKSCTCCEEESEEEPDNNIESSNHEVASLPPVQTITSINDLINESNLERHNAQFAPPEEDDIYLSKTIGVSEMETLSSGNTGGYLSGSFQFSPIKEYGSERSLQSIPSTPQFSSPHSINNLGVPIRAPTSSIGDFKNAPEGRSHDSLYNTAV